MLRIFRHIRKKLMEHPSKGRTGDNVRKYLLYAIDEILVMVIGKPCPVRDNIWVKTMESPKTHRAVRLRPSTSWYGIYRNRDVATNHIAYLQHAALCAASVFYLHTVPTGQVSFVKSPNPQNPRLPC